MTISMGGKQIEKRQAVMAVMAAANRDPDDSPIRPARHQTPG
jgi:hypothetical protein